MADVNTLSNPYLSIDKKYFKTSFEGQFVITASDLVNMPTLKNYINVSYLQNDKIIFDNFEISEKLEIGNIFFKYYEYITWIGDKKYLDFTELLSKFEIQENLVYEISKLNPSYYYKGDIETNMYDMDYINNTFLLLLITYYFYSRYSITEEVVKFIKKTEVFTDVDLNKHQYVKVKDNISFIVRIFNNWIRTSSNTIPFAPTYGNPLKELLQEKNVIVKLSLVKSAIINFFEELANLYNSLITVRDVNVNILNLYDVEIVILLTINKTEVTFNVISGQTYN